MKTFVLFLILFVSGSAAPWLDILFGEPTNYNYPVPNYKNEEYRRRQGKGGKERWKEICKTINLDPYAFPGRVPYPAGPVCPW